MKRGSKGLVGACHKLCRYIYTKTVLTVERHALVCMFVIGLGLLSIGIGGILEAQMNYSDTFVSSINEYDQIQIQDGVCRLFKLVETSFGAMVATIAGLGAIVAAAAGAYRAAVALLVVSVGAFILRSLISLFFGTGFCDASNAHSGVTPPGTDDPDPASRILF